MSQKNFAQNAIQEPEEVTKMRMVYTMGPQHRELRPEFEERREGLKKSYQGNLKGPNNFSKEDQQVNFRNAQENYSGRYDEKRQDLRNVQDRNFRNMANNYSERFDEKRQDIRNTQDNNFRNAPQNFSMRIDDKRQDFRNPQENILIKNGEINQSFKGNTNFLNNSQNAGGHREETAKRSHNITNDNQKRVDQQNDFYFNNNNNNEKRAMAGGASSYVKGNLNKNTEYIRKTYNLYGDYKEKSTVLNNYIFLFVYISLYRIKEFQTGKITIKQICKLNILFKIKFF